MGKQPQPEQGGAQQHGHDRHAPGSDRDLLLERASLGLDRARQPVDVPELGVGPGAVHDAAPGPRGHARAREDQVARLHARDVLEHRLGLPAHGLRLARQRRVVRRELGDRDKAAVSRDGVALREQDDVAWDERLGGHLEGRPLTQDTGTVRATAA